MPHRIVLHGLFSVQRYGALSGLDVLLVLVGGLLAALIGPLSVP